MGHCRDDPLIHLTGNDAGSVDDAEVLGRPVAEAAGHLKRTRPVDWRVLAGAVTAWYFVLAFAFVWVPGFWWDEAATVFMAEKPWDDFTATLRNVDGVHALYYLFMRGWSELFGLTTLSMRLVSALAIAATSLVLFQLGRTTLSIRVGVAAGVLYPLVPAAIWAAGEARSYALSGLAAALVLLALARALEQPTGLWRWVLLALAITMAGWNFLFTILMLPGTFLLVTRKEWRRHWRAIIMAVVASCAAILPLVWLAAGQRGQVSWISDSSIVSTLGTILVRQYLHTSPKYSLVIWAVVAVGAVLVWTRRRDDRRPMIGYATIVALPTLALALSGPVLGVPMYITRYLFFTTPALVMFVAILMARLTAPAIAALLIVLLVLGGGGSSLKSRLDPLSKSSWPYAAETLGSRAQPGDTMIAFSELLTGARVVYPQELGSLPLLNETITPEMAAVGVIPSRGGPLSDLVVPPDTGHVWYLSESHSRNKGMSNIDADVALLAKEGFAATWTSDPQGSQSLVIVLLER